MADAKAYGEVLTPLHTLAMDCLRLSMHFFHPIQQCAQHIYHSALPLSPTSSQLHESWLQGIIDHQLSHVVAFSGAPSAWGLLLRTIDVRPRQLTCITTSTQGIVAVCEDVVNIYDAVTGVPLQSLCTPETVIKVHGLPDGSILFLAHTSSVTMWDMQTGGLIHTFTTQSKINDIAVSTTGDHLACGSCDGSVTFWNIYTKEKGENFGNNQPVVTIHWLSLQELAVATQNALYVYNIDIGEISDRFSIPGHVWGMVYLEDEGKFLVGTSRLNSELDDECFFMIITYTQLCKLVYGRSTTHSGQLLSPILVGEKVVCITPSNGVWLFDTSSYDWTNTPLLLHTTTSMAILSNGNLVVQTADSIQIFPIGILMSNKACNSICSSHAYPLGQNHIICLKYDRHITLLKLETLEEIYPDNNTPLGSMLMDWLVSSPASSGCGLIAGFGISIVLEAWQSGAPLPEWTREANRAVSLCGLSPKCTWIATIYSSPQWELQVKDAKNGIRLASVPMDYHGFWMGKVYDLTFESDTRFYLKMDGPGWHVQIPHDIVESPLGSYSHKITQGEPVPLLEPRAVPPYALDENCEWVIDTESRKICWIPPGNIRRGSGGHFWAGLSLIMVGDDGIVRKLTFKKPGC